MRTFGGEGKDAGRREEEEWMRELMDGAVGRVCVPLRVCPPSILLPLYSFLSSPISDGASLMFVLLCIVWPVAVVGACVTDR